MKKKKEKAVRLTASEKLALVLSSIPSKFETRLISSFTNKKNFSKFEDVEVQRKINETNVCNLMKSFKKFGTGGSNITIIRTSAFGKVNQMVIGDGKHSVKAASLIGVGLNGRVVELIEDTKVNVLKYIATLNNTRAGWSNKVYSDGYSKIGSQEYILFNNLLAKHKKLTTTDLLFIFLGGSSPRENEMYKSGEMAFMNEAESMRLLKAVLSVIDVLPNKSYVRRSLYKVMRMTNNYNKFAEKILYSDMNFSENEGELYLQLVQLYKVGELVR